MIGEAGAVLEAVDALRDEDPGDVRVWQHVPKRARKRVLRRFTVVEVRGEPRFVAKLPLDPHDGKVVGELRNLARVRPGGLRITEPLAAVGRGFVMRYVPREDFPAVFAQLDGADRRATVERVVDEIAAFHAAAAPDASAHAVAEAYAGALPRSRPLARALDAARVGQTHGDLGPWNIRLDSRGEVAVIDWEDFREQGLPALDVLNFAFTLPLLVAPRHGSFDQLYRLTFEEPGHVSELVGAAVRRYASATGQDARDVADLLPVFLQGMIRRIEAEGRSAADLYFPTFLARFTAERPSWLDRLGE